MKIKVPVYRQIAKDVASKIAEGKFQVGEKIYARTSLATHYGVSSETARKAISLLDEMNVVKSLQGSGVIIKSREQAYKFLQEFQDIETISQIERNLISSIETQTMNSIKIKTLITDLVNKVKRFESTNPFIPYEILIDKNCLHLNKSINEVKFWNNTKATIVGIRRNGKLILSPGPEEIIKENDIIYYIGKESSQETVKNFLFSK